MSTPSQKPAYLRLPKVSPRDREIYHKVYVECRSQRVVAAEHKLSQPRICAILKRCKAWMQMQIPIGFELTSRLDRLTEQTRAHRQLLEHYRSEATRAWEESKKSQTTVKLAFDADHNEIKHERIGKSSPGNVRFLVEACKFSEKLLEFDGMNPAGSVNLAAKDRLPEHLKQTDDQTMVDIKKFIDIWLPRVVAWEAEKNQAELEKMGEVRQEVCKDNCAVKKDDCKMVVEVCEDIGPQHDCDRAAIVHAQKPLSNPLSPIDTANPAVKCDNPPEITRLSAAQNPLSTLSAATPAASAPPAPAPTPNPYAWLRPSLRYVVDDNPRRLPRMTLMPPRLYPPRTHYYDTRTGKRIEDPPKK